MGETKTLTISERFIQRVIDARSHLKMSQGEVADLCGISRAQFNRYENAKGEVSLELAAKISEVLKIPLTLMLTGSEKNLSAVKLELHSLVDRCDENTAITLVSLIRKMV